MNPLRYFLIPLGALVVLGLILTDEGTDGWVWLIVAPIILMAGVVSLGPQIKWWYWMRNAPDLPTAMAPVLERFSLYHSLDIEGKREFRRRAFLWRERINFQAQGVDKIPEDVQLMVAASATTLSFYRKDFLLGGFDSIVFYPHRFPSPQYEVLHASELYVPDGTMIFTIPYFVRSVFEPKNFLQLGLYEFSRAYQLVYPGQEFPAPSWQQIQRISSFSEEKLTEFIGLSELDRGAIGMVLYFTHTESMRQHFPDLFAAYAAVLRPT